MATLKDNVDATRRIAKTNVRIVKDQAKGMVDRLTREAMVIVASEPTTALAKLAEARESDAVATYCEELEAVLDRDPLAASTSTTVITAAVTKIAPTIKPAVRRPAGPPPVMMAPPPAEQMPEEKAEDPQNIDQQTPNEPGAPPVGASADPTGSSPFATSEITNDGQPSQS